METKKSSRANLEQRKLIFKEIGLISSLLLLFIVFEYSVKPNDLNTNLITTSLGTDIILPPVTPPDDVIKPKPIIDDIPKPDPIVPTAVVETKIKGEDESEKFTPSDLVDLTGLSSYPEPEAPKEKLPVMNPQKKAVFPGGEAALIAFIMKNINIPQDVLDIRQGGKVVIKYIVNENGKVVKPEIEYSSNILLNDEILRVINLLPDYTPAEQMGETVPTIHKVPVVIKLEYK